MRQYQVRKIRNRVALIALFAFMQVASVNAAELVQKEAVADVANSVANSVGATVTDEMLQQALGNMSSADVQSLSQTGTITPDMQALLGGTAEEEAEPINQGNINDPDSILFKANALAQERKINNQLKKSAGVYSQENVTGISMSPPKLQDLQNITDGFARDSLDSADAFLDGSVSADMRRDAQRNAALSYGARGGLAKRSFEIMEKMEDYSSVLDRVFDFKSLLIKAPSGMLVEPPIIKESLEAMVIKNGGSEAAIADSVFDINKNAKIVTAARNWRQYLSQTWSTNVAPPPKVLWPQNDKEKLDWKNWVMQGWEAGEKQAEQIFELNTNKLSADYKGMVRYRILLAQGMVSAPYTTHEERGVVGDDNQMRIGDRAVRITEPSRFLTGANIWRPADR